MSSQALNPTLIGKSKKARKPQVVDAFLSYPKTPSSAEIISSTKLIREMARGLLVKELDALQEALQVSRSRLGELLGISKATLQRRQSSQVLTSQESDKVVRYARLLGQTIEVFESMDSARRWLNSPQVGLGGEVALDYAKTEVGAREVEALLWRIDHGVYS
jgi:putative toxin-antitoxin system antitoxin component (TIGR02293 family)